MYSKNSIKYFWVSFIVCVFLSDFYILQLSSIFSNNCSAVWTSVCYILPFVRKKDWNGGTTPSTDNTKSRSKAPCKNTIFLCGYCCDICMTIWTIGCDRLGSE